MRLLFSAALLLMYITTAAQNIFDEPHTVQFANYLFNSGQYKLAAQEYERLVFMNHENDTAKIFLIKSYRKAGEFSKGLKRLVDLYDSTYLTNNTVLKEWTYLQVLQNNFDTIEQTLQAESRVDAGTKNYILLNTSLFQKKWKPALSYYNQGLLINESLFKPYQPVIDEAIHMKRKSPAAAAIFSTIIPGTGKVYTGQWKDALIAAVMIGATGYQAYRGYHKDGFNSVRFWAFGSIGAGFYLGNIYGSYKSARKYNQQKENEVINKSRRLFMVGD